MRMLEYARRLRDYSEKYSRESFLNDSLIQDAAGMCLINLGEFRSRLPDEYKKRHSGIPRAKIRGLRNIITHDYERVDWRRIWEIIQDGIPKLITELEQSLIKLEIENGRFNAEENYKTNIELLKKADEEFE
jgi:uncharacterized protein with HEPN domain